MEESKKTELRSAIDGFYVRFTELKAAIETLIAEGNGSSPDAKRAKLNLAHKKLMDVREEFKAALVYLPAYDQKSYQEGIKDLERTYSFALQAQQPAPKFSFKKRGLLSSSATNSESPITSSSSMPVYRGSCSANVLIVEEFNRNSLEITTQKNKLLEIEEFAVESDTEEFKSVHLTNLEACVINLFSRKQAIATIYIDDLVDCVVYSPPISNSVLIKNCKGCLFFLACHQFRMHTTSDTKIILHAASNPIIEDCCNVFFGPYNIRHSQLRESSERTNLSIQDPLNKYSLVEDFNWLKQSASPNWKLLTEDDRANLSELDVEEAITKFKANPHLNKLSLELLQCYCIRN